MSDEDIETPTEDTFNDTIAPLILNHLDGWILDTGEYTDRLEYNKKVTSDEVKQYYTTATNYAISYLGYNTTDTLEDHLYIFIYMWAAGLLWKKYDVRPNDLTDETYPIGYGDQLIITAKSGLTPYKKYNLTAW